MFQSCLDLMWKFRFCLSTQKEVRHVPVLFGPDVEIQVLFVHTERGEACSSLVLLVVLSGKDSD